MGKNCWVLGLFGSFRRVMTCPKKKTRVIGLGLVVLLLMPAAAHKYVGYILYRPEWGARAKIYTISPSIWNPANGLAEWVSVVLDFYSGYWVQVGYRKSPGYGIDFYMEKRDSNGYDKKILGSVSPYTWHTYEIRPGYVGQWLIYIDGAYKGNYATDPAGPVGLEAFVETIYTVMIDGSEFRDISCYLWGGVWNLWDDHDPRVQDPYHLIELRDYWFIAWGGG